MTRLQPTQDKALHRNTTVSGAESHQIQLAKQHTNMDIKANLFRAQQVTRHRTGLFSIVACMGWCFAFKKEESDFVQAIRQQSIRVRARFAVR